MIKFDVQNRFTGAVQFTAEIECDVRASTGLKVGLAVKWALKNGAYLGGANLEWADLEGAYLGGANLEWADLRGAYLRGASLEWADLRGASLEWADLRGASLEWADLRGADLIDGGQRSDGWRFVGQPKDGVLWIAAGCRYFAVDDARQYWKRTRGGTPLGEETFAILDHIEKVAAIRGLLKKDANE